jgi:hypothetical protein
MTALMLMNLPYKNDRSARLINVVRLDNTPWQPHSNRRISKSDRIHSINCVCNV